MRAFPIPETAWLSRCGTPNGAVRAPGADLPHPSHVALGLRIRLAALLLGTSTALLVAAYVLTVAMRLDLPSESRLALVALIAWTIVVVAIPRHASYSLFLAFPLFGNHPGAPLMELLNLHLAATTLGLTLRAWWRRRPPPGGALWGGALLVLLSAGLALIRTLPDAMIRAAQIDFAPSLVAQTLTAAETVPLYAVSSVIQLFLAMAWAYALCWEGADLSFARDALRYVALGLFAVMAVGILRFHGVIDVRGALLSRVDPHIDYLERFQSVFWNPGWFAWYFTMAFGLALGLLWLERPPFRHVIAVGLVVSYAYFLTNSQRGGFIAVHAVLLVAAMVRVSARPPSRRTIALAAAVVLVPLGAVSLGLFRGSRWFLGLQRFLTVADVNRWTLWSVALEMWRGSPLFGIGEGAFGWRFRDFIPVGSEHDIGAWGDAHSIWLQVLATRGAVGLVVFLALLVVLGRRILRCVRSAGPDRAIGLSLMFAFIAFLVYACVQWMFYLQATQALFWGIVALAGALGSGSADTRAASWRSHVLIAGLLVGAVAAQVTSSRPLFADAAAAITRQPRGFYDMALWARTGTPVRWSSRKGTLWLYPTGPVMTLEVRTTDPQANERPVTVTLSIEGRRLDRFELAREAVTRTLFLPESYRYRPPAALPPFGERVPGRPALPLTVEVSRLWTPYRTGSLDGRFLGVAVFAPSFRAVQPGEELGFLPPPRGGEMGVRWTGTRCSLSVSLPSERATLVLPLRPASGDEIPLRVEAFWDDHVVDTLVLRADRWHELRVEVAAETRRGVLTLQADRDVRPDWRGSLLDIRHTSLRIGSVRVESTGVDGATVSP
jgi:O-antigen ligase